jgi:exopolyphosphatase/guanosine-5'-triphosphate,3'-diphosphate pyrophosphatase
MKVYAAIDLGTNTARLLIGTLNDSGAICPLLVKRAIIRLGGGFTKEQGISPEAWQRAVATLTEFTYELKAYNVSVLRAVATSAVRDALNGPAFCHEVLALTGIRLEVIDGEEEGLLTLQGVRSCLVTEKRHLLVQDIGGGSTEFTLASENSPLFIDSLPLGVVRLTESKVGNEAIVAKIDKELSGLRCRLEQKGWLDCLSDAELVATAGTATTLAAIHLQMADYDYRKVNNYVLLRQEIQEIFEQLEPLAPADRLAVIGLEPGREDLIIAGILLTLRAMDLFGFKQLKVSDYGLLEGLFLSVAAHSQSKVRR